MPQEIEGVAVEITVGALFVLLDGWNRFNDPVEHDSVATFRALHLDSRSSTTAVSYYGALGLYLATLLTAFALLAANENHLQPLVTKLPLGASLVGIGIPMLAALVMIVVVPQAKPLSTFERSLRGRLQRWASIPVEVSRFAHDLQGYRFLPKDGPAGSGQEVRGSETGALSLSDPFQRHLRASTLLNSLEAWKSSRLFGGYFATYQGVYEQLARDAQRLGRQIEAYREDVAERGADNRLVRSQREGLEDGSKELLKQVCYFVAAGILRCCPLESARNRELERLGFVPSERPWPILPGQVTLVLLSVTAVCVAFFVVDYLIPDAPQAATKAKETIGDALLKSVRIASFYVAATLSAVYLWHRSQRPPAGRLSERPYHRYLAAAGLAVGVCTLLSLLFWLAFHGGDPQKMFAGYRERIAYQLLTAATGFGIAFLLDDSWGSEVSVRKQRLREGAALGVLIASLVPLAYLLLGRDEPARLLRMFLLGPSLGFLIGSCIPVWCRENRQRLASGARRPEREPVLPAGLPQQRVESL